MTETRIYVGLNDSVTKTQLFDTEKYVPFSFHMAQGGYIHDNGEYKPENSLILTLIDVDEATVQEVAKDLCVFFHQESVLVTVNNLKVYSIREEL